jgi:hypothetical protein
LIIEYFMRVLILERVSVLNINHSLI